MSACPSRGIFKPFGQSLKANGHPKGLTIVPTPHKTQPPGKRVYKTGLRWRDAAFEKEDIVMKPAQANVYWGRVPYPRTLNRSKENLRNDTGAKKWDDAAWGDCSWLVFGARHAMTKDIKVWADQEAPKRVWEPSSLTITNNHHLVPIDSNAVVMTSCNNVSICDHRHFGCCT